MTRCIRTAAVAILILSGAATLYAAKVKVWHQFKPAHFDRAKLKQTVVSNEGSLRLSRQLKPLAGIEAAHVWDLAEDKNGNLYVATGDAGKIFKVASDGKVTVAHASEDSQVLCLVAAPDGSVYAGTGPTGRIIRIDPQGEAKVIHSGLNAYVWSLAVDAKGEHLFAGTGPGGKVIKLSPDGQAKTFFTSKQEHILSVAVGPDGQVYAGTDRNGLVYRIDAQGKGFVLYQAPQSEVRSLQVTADGVFFGTSAPSGSRRGSTVSSHSDSSAGVAPKVPAVPASQQKPIDKDKEKKPETVAAPSEKPKTSDKDDDKVKPASAPSSPSSGENSVYRIAADGTVREVFREKALVLSLLQKDGRFLVGTGMGGQLHEVDEKTRERTEIARLDHGQILCLLQRANGSVVIGAGDPGKLYVLEDRYAASGTVLSDVFDAKIVSKWGSLRWQAQTPAGAKLTVAVRSGNVADPDDTWSDWSIEQPDGDKASVLAPAARFVQYRVTMTTENPKQTPVLRGLALRYATTNQAPEVTSVETPNLDAEDLDNPKKLKFKWKAEDANEDAVTYDLYVKKDGWTNWVLLDDDHDKTDFEWDTTTTPSGVYRLKVVASDRKDNPPDEALTGSRISDPFVVSHTPPQVSITVVGVDGDKAIVKATGESDLVRLTSASFSVNGKKWQSVFPTDSLFDSKSETFAIRTESLKPGTYVVVLRVKDAAGNTGSADAVFTVEAKGK